VKGERPLGTLPSPKRSPFFPRLQCHCPVRQLSATLGHGLVTGVPLRTPAHLRQAEIHERLGNRARAAGHYEQFVELRRSADAEFQPAVDAARRRLSSLTRRIDSNQGVHEGGQRHIFRMSSGSACAENAHGPRERAANRQVRQ
jgi:hypothetical protein